MDRYKKLTQDLIKAKLFAKTAADSGDDGGTANLDSLVLYMPKARKEKVLESIRAAGLYCRSKSKWMGSTCYFVGHGCGGQGNRNTRAVEAMKDSLRQDGWDVNIFYKID